MSGKKVSKETKKGLPEHGMEESGGGHRKRKGKENGGHVVDAWDGQEPPRSSAPSAPADLN